MIQRTSQCTARRSRGRRGFSGVTVVSDILGPHLLLERAQPVPDLRQAAKHRLLAPPDGDRRRRDAGDRRCPLAPTASAADFAATWAPSPSSRCPDDARLPRQDDAGAEPGAARDPRPVRRGSNARPTTTLCPTCTRLSILVPAPIDVAPRSARSIAVRAPISTSGADLDPPHLRDLVVHAAHAGVAEAVASQHRPGMDFDAIAPGSSRIEHDVGMQHAPGRRSGSLPRPRRADAGPYPRRPARRGPARRYGRERRRGSRPRHSSPTTAVGGCPGLDRRRVKEPAESCARAS